MAGMSKKNKEYKEKAKKKLESHIDINCKKCGAVGSEHSCPYSDEMNQPNTDYFFCTCCKTCTRQCAEDI